MVEGIQIILITHDTGKDSLIVTEKHKGQLTGNGYSPSQRTALSVPAVLVSVKSIFKGKNNTYLYCGSFVPSMVKVNHTPIVNCAKYLRNPKQTALSEQHDQKAATTQQQTCRSIWSERNTGSYVKVAFADPHVSTHHPRITSHATFYHHTAPGDDSAQRQREHNRWCVNFPFSRPCFIPAYLPRWSASWS